MKYYILFLLSFFVGFSSAQDKYLTKTGVINFEASVPSFEEVKATSSSVTAILNTANGEFACLALLKSFRFKIALMEEHFNENYVESDLYPKAILKGKIKGFNFDSITSEKTTLKLNGSLTLHGITKPISSSVVLRNVEGILMMTSNFQLKPEDFNIKIPKIVRNKVSDSVSVSVSFSLIKK